MVSTMCTLCSPPREAYSVAARSVARVRYVHAGLISEEKRVTPCSLCQDACAELLMPQQKNRLSPQSDRVTEIALCSLDQDAWTVATGKINK